MDNRGGHTSLQRGIHLPQGFEIEVAQFRDALGEPRRRRNGGSGGHLRLLRLWCGDYSMGSTGEALTVALHAGAGGGYFV